MFSLIKSSFKADHPNKRSVLRFILFILISGMTALFTLGRFEVTGRDDSIEMPFLDRLHYYPGLAPDLTLTILLTILYLAITVLLFYLIRKEIKYHPLAISLFLFSILIRIVSIFTFTYTKTSFLFHSIVNDDFLVIPYSGYSISDRISTFLNDFCFITYFFTLYYSIKPVMKHNKSLFHGLFALIQLVVLSMVAYSFLYQFDLIQLSFKLLFFHPGEFYPFYGFSSYLTHRNAFGFFLFIASLLNISEFIEKPKISFLLLNLLYLIFLVLIISKTPLLLLIISYVLGFGILYPAFYYKEHKGYSICFSMIFLGLISFFLLSYFAYDGTIFHCYILPFFKSVTNWSTMDSRRYLNQTALSMLDERSFWLGYNRYPFIELNTHLIHCYPQFDQIVTYTSHNSYIDLLMFNGIFGLLIPFLVVALYEKRLFRKMFAQHQKENFFYFLQTIVIFVYSYSEPRCLFLEEGTFLFFVLLIIHPYVSMKEADRKKILLENLI